MFHAVTTRGEVLADHTLVLSVPADIPPGPVTVTISVEEQDAPKIRTLGDLLDSGFVGMFADRDDLPKTNEEFIDWRRRLWERKPD